MNDVTPLRLLISRVGFVALALLILLGNLLPLQTGTRGWAAPDCLFLVAMVWSVRRPELVPLPLLAGLFLLADLILSRPPGLMAALMLMGCASLQWSGRSLRDSGFGAECVRVAVIVIGIVVLDRIILSLLLVPPPPLGLTAFQSLATIFCYPLAVLICSLLFGIRMTAPGDIDATGHRT